MELVYKLSEAFHQDRRQELFKRLYDTDLDLLMVFDATTMAYLTGFFHMTTERPIGIGFTADGSVFALTTELEIDQLRGKAPWLDEEKASIKDALAAVKLFKEYTMTRQSEQNITVTKDRGMAIRLPPKQPDPALEIFPGGKNKF